MPFYHIISKLHIINLTYYCWFWPWFFADLKSLSFKLFFSIGKVPFLLLWEIFFFVLVFRSFDYYLSWCAFFFFSLFWGFLASWIYDLHFVLICFYKSGKFSTIIFFKYFFSPFYSHSLDMDYTNVRTLVGLVLGTPLFILFYFFQSIFLSSDWGIYIALPSCSLALSSVFSILLFSSPIKFFILTIVYFKKN